MILPIVIVTIRGAQNDIPRDLDSANMVWGGEMEIWVDAVANLVVDRPALLVLAQNDCAALDAHTVSVEEDALFDLGRAVGTDVVGYYIAGDTAGFAGCAAHPPGRRGFWVGEDATRWTFIHEATHVVGRNPHADRNDTDNLMVPGTFRITNPPPDLNDAQRARILNDPALLCIPSMVLNL